MSVNIFDGANDLFLDEEDPGFQEFLASPEDVAKIQTASEFRDELMHRLFEQPLIVGPAVRLNKIADALRFPDGQVTLWAGHNGHGKSLITSQVLLDLACQDLPGLICSFEMSPIATLARMVRQAAGNAHPTREFAEAFVRWAQGRVWIYNHRGQAPSEKLVDLCRYAVKKLGIKQILWDNLARIVKGTDDYDGQKLIVGEACNLALGSSGKGECHVHIVHHLKKGMDEYQIPGKMDIKGAGEIADQVDTIVMPWRNLRLEEQRRNGEEVDKTKPDAVFNIVKSRHIEAAEGKYGFYYCVGAQSYTDVCGHPVRFPEIDRFMPRREVAL